MKTKTTALYAAFTVAFGLAIVATSPVSADNHEDMMKDGMRMEHMMEKGMHSEMREEVRTAVEANDYTLLSVDAMEELDEEDFAEMVERHIMMMEHRDTIQAAIVAKDYDAFSLEVEAHHVQMQEMREEEDMDDEDVEGDDEDEEDDNNEDMMKRYEKMSDLTDEEKTEMMKTHYDYLVEYYEVNGELPDMMDMMKEAHPEMMNKGEKGEMTDEMKAEHEARKAAYEEMTDEEKMAMKSEMKEKKGDIKEEGEEMKKEMKKERKYFKEAHRGLVRNAVKTVDADRLEKALARIDVTLDVVTDEKVIDLLEGIREVIMEALG